MDRIANFTEINDDNSEFLQLLRYEKGQFYKKHHDYIGIERNRQQGVRILTVYLYLNDVEAGGGTNFPLLDLTVMPKRGRALLWPSVLDAKPEKEDFLTNHQALPVEAGVKYGANAWYHIRDFKTPNRNHCQ
jgi:prolyl 4-hydroxylase